MPMDGAGVIDAGVVTGGADEGLSSGTEVETTESTGTETEGQEQEFELDEEGNQVLDDEGNPKAKQQQQTKGKTDFKSTYESIKEANPQAAEAYRKDHFSTEAYKKAFATPREAVETRQLLDNIGGVEGLTQLQTDAEEYATELNQVASGDPEIIKSFLSNPETKGGIAKLVPTALSIMAAANKEIDPELHQAFQDTVRPYFSSSLDTYVTPEIYQAGVSLNRIVKQMEAAGQDTSQLENILGSLDKVYKYTTNIKSAVEKGETTLSAKEKQLQQQSQEVAKQKEEIFMNQVRTSVNTTINASISKVVAPLIKGKNLTSEQKQDLVSGIMDLTTRQLQSNDKYQKQLKTLLKQRDSEKVAQFVKQNFDRLVSDNAKKVWARRGYSNLTAKSRTAVNNSTTVLARKPKRDDVDWNKTSDIDFMSGKAVLKGTGKQVSFKWEDQS